MKTFQEHTIVIQEATSDAAKGKLSDSVVALATISSILVCALKVLIEIRDIIEGKA